MVAMVRVVDEQHDCYSVSEGRVAWQAGGALHTISQAARLANQACVTVAEAGFIRK